MNFGYTPASVNPGPKPHIAGGRRRKHRTARRGGKRGGRHTRKHRRRH